MRRSGVADSRYVKVVPGMNENSETVLELNYVLRR